MSDAIALFNQKRWLACVNAVQDEFMLDYVVLSSPCNSTPVTNARALLLLLAASYTTLGRTELAKRLDMGTTWTWKRKREIEKAIEGKQTVSLPRWGPMRADVVWEKLRFDVERKINERTVAA